MLKFLGIFAGAVLLALSSAGQAATPSSEAGDVPRLEDFAALPFISDPLLSPDGKRIAARVIGRGVTELAIYELPAGATSQPVLVPLGGLPVRWFRWAGSDRLLVGYSQTILIIGSGTIAIAPASRLKRYELSSKSLIDIGPGQGLLGDDVIFTDPWGRFILLSAQADADDSPSVTRIDLKTGQGVEVQPKRRDIWNWFADAHGQVRGGISYSGKGYNVYYRGEPGGELRRTATGRIPDDSVVDSIHIMPGGDKGVIITNAATGRFGVYEYRLGSQETGAALFEHPEVDVSSIEISTDGSRVEGIRFEDDRPRIAWLVPELKSLQAQIDRTFPGKVNQILNRSDDSSVVLVWSGSGDDPGSYYVFDRKARRMNLFASPFDPMVGKRLAPVKSVRYPARDGLSIPAYLTLPPGKAESKGLPMVMLPHGGPFIRNSYGYDPWAQFLASRGYAVLQPNFRGSTGYGRAFVERGYGQWGAAMQDDLDDGVAWLASEGIADPKRVCIMGASYGGYAALWAAVRDPDKYRCAISFAGVTDIRAMLKYDTRMAAAPRYSKRWRQKVVGEEQRDLAALSPLQQARRIAIPVLIAHGEADSNVPVDHAKKLIAALKKAGIAHEAVLYPGVGHGLEKAEDSIDFLKRVEAFLTRHNPA